MEKVVLWRRPRDITEGKDDRCWNHDFIATRKRFRQCTNKATWFYYDDSSAKNDTVNKIYGVVSCQLCDSCYELEKQKPESQQVFDPELFQHRDH